VSHTRICVTLVLLVVACGEPERNPPAPPGGTAGSVSFGEGGTAATEAATTTGPGTPTDGSGSGGSGSSSSDDGGSELTGPASGPVSATGGSTCVPGEFCEESGICVTRVTADGIEVVCSHGTPGEACSIDENCDSMMCVSMVTGDGVVSTCA
jgi:hypothetical protein